MPNQLIHVRLTDLDLKKLADIRKFYDFMSDAEAIRHCVACAWIKKEQRAKNLTKSEKTA